MFQLSTLALSLTKRHSTVRLEISIFLIVFILLFLCFEKRTKIWGDLADLGNGLALFNDFDNGFDQIILLVQFFLFFFVRWLGLIHEFFLVPGVYRSLRFLVLLCFLVL